MPKNNKPVHEIKAWPVRAAIWRQESKNGAFYNVTFERSYKDKDDDQYKSSGSFNRDDLLSLAQIATKAWHWIVGQEAKDHQQTSGTE